jgi:DNA topoisomerase-1
MDLDSVTLDEAVRLLTLPRTVGEIDGEPVTVQNGRYGPYAKMGTDSRSLESEDQLFTLTLDQARAIFAQPKQRGRAARGAAAPPLREIGDDTASGKPIVLREGRFGPYVTDGETNASLRKGDAPESITLQRAIELLADRRAAAPAPKRRSPGPARSGTTRTAAAAKKPAKSGAAKKPAGTAKAGGTARSAGTKKD